MDDTRPPAAGLPSPRDMASAVSIVSCSKTNRLPTSLEYRLITTLSLVG
jgi:hypothetical protein